MHFKEGRELKPHPVYTDHLTLYSEESFSNLLQFLSNFIDSNNSLNKFPVFLFGDFNFPSICWDNLLSKRTSPPMHTALFNFMDKHLFSQFIHENTRKNNILDLLLTDNPNFVQLVQVKDISISDHCLVQIFTSFFSNSHLGTDLARNYTVEGDSGLDFSKFNLQSSDYYKINQELSVIDWKWVTEVEVEDFPNIFHQIVFSILEKHSKLNSRYSKSVSSFQRSRNIINRKIRKYKKKILLSSDRVKLDFSKEKIFLLQEEKKKSFFEERLSKETRAIDRIKTDVKYFFKYANSFRSVPSSPGILVDNNGKTITDQKAIDC